jgi:hypothetical protein
LIILSNNIIISVIGISISVVLFIFMIYKFIKNNPLYIYYCYALNISGIFFLFYILTIYPVLGFFLLPEILYIYTFFTKTEIHAHSLVPYDNSINVYMNFTPKSPNTCKIYKRAKITDMIKKQYDSKTNFRYSLIFFLSLIIIFIFHISL